MPLWFYFWGDKMLKKIVSISLSVCMVFAVLSFSFVTVGAETIVTEGDFQFALNTDNTVSVYKYLGTDAQVIVPNMGNGKTVAGVRDYAFYGNATMESITLPDSVKAIGAYAFANCKELQSFIAPASLFAIHEYAFNNCISLVSCDLSTSAVTDLPVGLFAGCTSLADFEIPEGVSIIQNFCFKGSGLTHIELPDSVITVYSGAFENCFGIQSAVLSENLKKITQSSFKNCTALQSIQIPNGITEIAASAFMGCTALEKAEIGINCTVFGDRVFENTPLLTVYGFTGSAAESYCLKQQIPFIDVTVPVFDLGDVNEDGEVNVIDVTDVQLYAAGDTSLHPFNLQTADVNQDGKVNVQDATEIQLLIASAMI